jgi:uncharacterized protein (TIGR03437 family)
MLICTQLLIAQTGVNPPRWEVQYTKVYTEGKTVGPGTGILLGGGTSIVTDPALMIGAGPSIRLDNTGNNASIGTNPDVWPLSPNTTYILELQYRIVNRGANTDLLFPTFSPTDLSQQQLKINMPSLYANAASSGTFSSGVLTNNSRSYTLNITAGLGVSIIVGNIAIYRQDTVQTTAPPAWSGLDSLPFPRLGAWYTGNPDFAVKDGRGGVPPYYYTLDQIENSLALADVIVGFDNTAQTLGMDSIRRLRQLNPTAAIVSEHTGGGVESVTLVPPTNSGFVNLLYEFQQGIADPWYLRDSHGNYVFYAGGGFQMLNMTPYCPTVNGQSYDSYLAGWITGNIFSSGLWDGFWSDDLFAVINPHLSTRFPSLDADYNANGIRDETPAAVSEWMRSGVTSVLQSVRDRVGDTELLTGNTGPEPQVPLAPYVNGFVQECTNCAWEPSGNGTYDEAGWRRVFDDYRAMQANVRRPAINIFNGYSGAYFNYTGTFVTPSDADIARARMVMGTALLDDGYFHYSLCCPAAPPAWFDEMTVDGNGLAVQDRRYKGYLGKALSSATELEPGGPVLLQQDFEAPPLPASLSASGTVYVSNDPNEIISGQGSLVLSNPDHTQSGTVTVSTVRGAIQLTPGHTYLVRLDFRVLETLDGGFSVTLCGDKACTSTKDISVNIAKGDRGTINLPLTVASAADNWTLSLAIFGGGGKIAIDNLRVLEGGAGPWRRDFENGLVLVNPLNTPHTFSATDLAGVFHRTGIHRIKGTQAPGVNNGQAVTDSLTLGPFDAIVLLADPIPLGTPVVTGVNNAAGGQPGVASGAFVSIYGSNFTPLPYDDWSKSITNGQLPKQLDGIRVTMGGKPAYIYAVSPGQINVQAPDLGNGPVQVVVTGGGVTSTPFGTNSQLYSPAFFLWPGNQPVATHGDYSIAAKNGTLSGLTTVPAKPGEVITLWGTGFGPTNPAVPAGQEPTVQAPPTQTPVTVTLGATPVPVFGAVLSSYAALYQIAIQIPASMTDGDYSVVATVNGTQSPNTILTVQH